MNFTPAQIVAIKYAIANDSDMPSNPDAGNNPYLVADLFNSIDANTYYWRINTDAPEVENSTEWAKFTPVDAADGTALFTNRNLVCQSKQITLQTLLQGKTSVNSVKPNIREGFRVALTDIPSGVGGALVDAGWSEVKVAMTRHGTRLEQLLAGVSGTSAEPAYTVYDGVISAQEVADIIGAP